MGIPSEKGIAMSTTHSGLCKFTSVEDDNWFSLSQQIADLAYLSVSKIREMEQAPIQLAERFLSLPSPSM